MDYSVACLWLAMLLFCGCSDGEQRGLFSASGSRSRSVDGAPGSLTIVQGDPLPLTQQSSGTQTLLYILTLAPKLDAQGEGSKFSSGSTVSTFTEYWFTPTGKVEMELSWDRQTDTVSVGGKTFDRRTGNAFVLIRDDAGAIGTTQVGPLASGLDPFQALPKIQEALPDTSQARTISLVR